MKGNLKCAIEQQTKLSFVALSAEASKNSTTFLKNELGIWVLEPENPAVGGPVQIG